MADDGDVSRSSARWHLTRPTLVLHAVLGFVLFLAAAPFLPDPPTEQMAPQTVTAIALGGAFVLAVLVSAAASLARRLATGGRGRGSLAVALVLGLAGPVVFGLAGSSAWGVASLFVAREIGAMVVLPAGLAGAVAPALAFVCASLLVFERRT